MKITLAPSPERVRPDLTLPKVNDEIILMQPNPTPPYWIRTTPRLSVTVTEPPLDLEPYEPDEPASPTGWSSHRSLLLFLGVFFVATLFVNLWPDEGHVASQTEAGIDAEGVVASLVAERREHAALATVTAATDAPASGDTRPQGPGGKAGNDENGQAATTTPDPAEAPTPGKGNLTLPLVGETPLPQPDLPDVPRLDVPLPGVSAPPLPDLPAVPPVPGTLLP